MAISVASADHEVELRNRRDGIVEKLFAPPCQNCVEKKDEIDQQSLGLIDDEADEQRKILEIRNLLDDHSQVFSASVALILTFVFIYLTNLKKIAE